MLRGPLVLLGCKIGRRHVKTLTPQMRVEALYRRPRTTKPTRPQDLSVSAALRTVMTYCSRRIRDSLMGQWCAMRPISSSW